jgi:hypothetical protein
MALINGHSSLRFHRLGRPQQVLLEGDREVGQLLQIIRKRGNQLGQVL